MTRHTSTVLILLVAAALLASCVPPTEPDTPRIRITDPTPYFLRTIDLSQQDQGFDVKQLSDSGFIIVGHTYRANNSSIDMLLTRTDEEGHTLWVKTFGGIYADEAYSVVETPDGGFLLAGTTQSFTNGYTDIWLLRTDAMGELRWYRNYGGTGKDYLGEVINCSTGGFLMTGSIEDPIAKKFLTVVMKLDDLGGITWDYSRGGSERDLGSAAMENDDGTFLIGCTTEFRGNGKTRIHLFTMTSDGYVDTSAFNWESAYGEPASKALSDFAFSPTGTIGIIGDINPSTSASHMLFITISLTSGIVEEQILQNDALGKSIAATSDGGFIVCGYTEPYGGAGSDIILLKFDATGKETWRKTIGGSHLDRAFGISNVADGGFILTGTTESFGVASNGSSDLLLLKTDANGNYEEAH
ncbi:MAG: hypothetical protein WBQ23_07370 [Bacteroidota bacterium]